MPLRPLPGVVVVVVVVGGAVVVVAKVVVAGVVVVCAVEGRHLKDQHIRHGSEVSMFKYLSTH